LHPPISLLTLTTTNVVLKKNKKINLLLSFQSNPCT
jgi:hypothetical protein